MEPNSVPAQSEQKDSKPTAPSLPKMQLKDQQSNVNNKVTNFVGRTVNGFEIQKLIGQGKFSFVFRAKRTQDNVLVALKLIKVSLGAPYRRRFSTWTTKSKETTV